MISWLSGPLGLITLLIAATAASWLFTKQLIVVLKKRHVLDRPNERSSHTIPTPRGGGIAVVGVFTVISLPVAMILRDHQLSAVILGAIALSILSFLDDLRGLGAAVRMGAQLFVVAALLALPTPFGPAVTTILGAGGAGAPWFLPWVLEACIIGFMWLWFINLTNFMDGVDGITGVETISVTGGVAVLWAIMGTDSALVIICVTMIGATAGFLIHNWHPARIFLGDVGSIPIGLLLGWMLLDLAAQGLWASAFLLPLYYLIDATLTLLRRIVRGERFWSAHRTHAYQIAVQRGAKADQVSLRVAILNAFLLALACVAAFLRDHPSIPAGLIEIGALAMGFATCIAVMRHFQTFGRADEQQ